MMIFPKLLNPALPKTPAPHPLQLAIVTPVTQEHGRLRGRRDKIYMSVKVVQIIFKLKFGLSFARK